MSKGQQEKTRLVVRHRYVGRSEKIGNRWRKITPQEAGQRLNAHLKYIEYRSREVAERREDRYLFTSRNPNEDEELEDQEGDQEKQQRQGDRVKRQEALEVMMGNVGSEEGRGAYYHKLMLSPAESTMIQGQDGKAFVRECMHELEKRLKLNLIWYADQHSNTNHPHFHIILAGSGLDRDGNRQNVRLGPEDYTFLREYGKEREQRTLQEQDQQDRWWKGENEQERRDTLEFTRRAERDKQQRRERENRDLFER